MARVALLKIALYQDGPVASRAADLLRAEGWIIALPVTDSALRA